MKRDVVDARPGAASAAAVASLPSRPRRLALLVPMKMELRPLILPLRLVREPAAAGSIYRGRCGDVEIAAALTGMGFDNAAACAARLLDAFAAEHVVVAGIAGGLGDTVAIGDLVVPERVLNLDTGDSFDPAPLGERKARGLLACSDRLLESPGEAGGLAAQGIVAIDMETAAIADCCRARGLPWSVFRGISDRADDGTTDLAVLRLARQDGSPDLAAVCRFVLSQPWRIPQLARLARGSAAASRAAAGAVVNALG